MMASTRLCKTHSWHVADAECKIFKPCCKVIKRGFSGIPECHVLTCHLVLTACEANQWLCCPRMQGTLRVRSASVQCRGKRAAVRMKLTKWRCLLWNPNADGSFASNKLSLPLNADKGSGGRLRCSNPIQLFPRPQCVQQKSGSCVAIFERQKISLNALFQREAHHPSAPYTWYTRVTLRTSRAGK